MNGKLTFDLNAALNGCPVWTRKGVPVTGFKKRGYSNEKDTYPYMGLIGEVMYETFTPDGLRMVHDVTVLDLTTEKPE